MNPPTGLTITAFYSLGDWAGYCHIKWTSPTQPADAYYRIEYHDVSTSTWIWQTDVPPDQSAYGVRVQFATAPSGGTPKTITVDHVRITAKDVAGISPDAAVTIDTPTSLTPNHVSASNFSFICSGKIGDTIGSIDFTWNDLTLFVRNGTITLSKYGVTSPGINRVLYSTTFSATPSELGPNRASVPISLMPPGIPLDANLTWDPLDPPSNDSNAPFWVVEGDLLTLSITTTADDDPNTQSAEFTFEYYRVAGIDSFSHTLVDTMADSFTLAITQDPYLDVLITAAVAYVSGLPAGMSFNSSTLVVSGTPTVIGTFLPIFAITSEGHFINQQQYEIFVISVESLGLTWPVLTAPPTTVNLTRGVPYDPNLGLYGPGSGPYQIAAGILPSGLILDTATGEITGIPVNIETQLVSFEKAATHTPAPPVYISVVSVDVVDGGDYFIIPTVLFDQGGMVTYPDAFAHVNLITALVVNGGTGYSVSDVLTIVGGTFGTVAKVTIGAVGAGGNIIAVPSSPVVSVPITDGGVYETQAVPGVTFTGGGPLSNATATARFGLAAYTVAGGGHGYIIGDVLNVIGGTYDSPAQITVDAIGTGGSISLSHVSANGAYRAVPTPPTTLSTGLLGGNGALIFANWTVVEIIVTNGGFYTGTPSASVGTTGVTPATLGTPVMGTTIAGGLHINQAGDYMAIPDNPVTVTTTGGGSGATINLDWGVSLIDIISGGQFSDTPTADLFGASNRPGILGDVTMSGTYDPGGPWGPNLDVTFNVVESQAPVITSPAEVHFIRGQIGTYVITTDAGNDYWRSGPTEYWKAGSGELPEGMFLKDNIIYGVPTDEPGIYPIYLQAGNSAGYGPMFLLSLWVDVAIPVITSPLTVSAIVGEPFFYQIVATNNPFFYGADGLPDGLDVGVTGIISGTPTGISTPSVTLTAINDNGAGTATLALAVALPPIPVIDTTTLMGNAITVDINEPFTFQPSATNNPTRWTADPLPQGLSFNTLNGTLSGQFQSNGFYDITFVAYNAGGASLPVIFHFAVGVTATGNGTPPPPPTTQLPIDIVNLWVDLDSSAVGIDGPGASMAAATVKRGDSTVITVIFHRAGVPVAVPLAKLYFGAKVAFDDDYIVYSDVSTRIDDGKYRTYPDFSDQNNDLDSILVTAQTALIGEIQWDLTDGTRRSTQTFDVTVLRDLLHPDPAP